uniref:Microtubule-associated tumor suppressor candidate 2 n=1 Tax=Nomascus leucogenys TaxID=61853 RepID=G1QIH1_NOMLE
MASNPTKGLTMSVPVAPKKSCYTQLRDNRNAARNNNESILSLGDTNANQSCWRHVTWKMKLEIQIQVSQKTVPISIRNFTKFRALGKALRLSTQWREAQIACRPRGVFRDQVCRVGGNVMGEASLDVLAKRDAEIPRHVPKDKLAKTLDNEELRRHSLERASSSVAAVGSLTPQHPQPVPLDSGEARGQVPGGGEGPQKTLPDHAVWAAFPATDSTSEGKSVRHPKPSTSETKQSTPSETQTVGAHVLQVCREHTSRSTHPEPALNLTLASKESPSKPEAQLGQGKGEAKLELKYVPPRRVEQEGNAAQEGYLGCHKEENLSALEGRDPCGEAHTEATDALGRLPNSDLHHLGVGRGNCEEKRGVNPGEQDSLHTTPKQGSASLGGADNQPTGKVSPCAGGKLGERTSSSFSPGDGHVAFIPHNLTDSKPSDVTEEERRLGSGTKDSVTVLAFNPSVGESKTEVPEPLDPQSGSSEARESKEITTSVAENRNLLENADKTESTSARADSIVNIPAPLHPETTVNLTHQPTTPSSSFQDVSVFGMDVGSPLVVPPTTDSARLLNTSPKVPDKNTCPSGIPKPVFTHSKDTPSSQEGMENHQGEKTEERTETKPIIMPKPKHVRPKIITYIRRNPQALGQVDASLVPVGLPYAPPTCTMPLPHDEKAAGGDLKPSANLYEKFKPDLQKPRVFSSGLMVSGIKPPGHPFSQMSEKFLQEVTDHPGKEEFCSPPYAHYEVPPTFYRSAMLLKPQLGLGAMSRLPSAKSRILIASQRSSASAIHPPGPITTATSLYTSDPSADLKKASSSNAAKSNLPKSGLRPPGYSRLPAAKLAAFGFVRSSSVSSVSSTQSGDSAQPEQGRPATRKWDGHVTTADVPEEDLEVAHSAVPLMIKPHLSLHFKVNVIGWETMTSQTLFSIPCQRPRKVLEVST